MNANNEAWADPDMRQTCFPDMTKAWVVMIFTCRQRLLIFREIWKRTAQAS